MQIRPAMNKKAFRLCSANLQIVLNNPVRSFSSNQLRSSKIRWHNRRAQNLHSGRSRNQGRRDVQTNPVALCSGQIKHPNGIWQRCWFLGLVDLLLFDIEASLSEDA